MVGSSRVTGSALLGLAVAFAAWKTHILINRKHIVFEKFNFTEAYDRQAFDTSKSFRVIDADCEVVISPAVTPEPLYLLVLVLTAPKHKEARERSRKLEWMPPDLPKTRGGVKTVFVIGSVQDEGLQKDIEEESAQFGDILQISHPDGYRNLPYKSIASFLWASQNYNPRYIAKADDDLLLNGHNWFQVMEEKYPEHTTPEPDTMHCVVLKKFKPLRDSSSINAKYSVSETLYPQPQYPDYCNGWLYILTPQLAEKLGVAASKTPYINVDDIYVTGLVRERIENAKLEFLATGRLWRWFIDWLTECEFFSFCNLFLASDVFNTSEPGSRPKILVCSILERFVHVCEERG